MAFDQTKLDQSINVLGMHFFDDLHLIAFYIKLFAEPSTTDNQIAQIHTIFASNNTAITKNNLIQALSYIRNECLKSERAKFYVSDRVQSIMAVAAVKSMAR